MVSASLFLHTFLTEVANGNVLTQVERAGFAEDAVGVGVELYITGKLYHNDMHMYNY